MRRKGRCRSSRSPSFERRDARAHLNSHLPIGTPPPGLPEVIVVHPDARLAELLREAIRDASVRHEPGLDGGLVRLRSAAAAPVAVVVLDLGSVPREEVTRVLETVMAADAGAQLVVTRTRGALDDAGANARLWIHRRGERGRGDDDAAVVSLVARARKRWDLQRLWRPSDARAEDAPAPAGDARRESARRVLRVVDGQLHDPLTSLAERLAEAVDYPETAPLAELARDAKRLVEKLEAVRELCRLDLGHEPPVPATFALARLLGEVLVHGRRVAADRPVALHIGRLPDAPTHVFGPENVVRRALTELVENAVRYAGGGGVSLAVDLREKHGGGLIARFSVDDAGPGIAEDELERAWTRYARLGTAAGEPGEGIGLAVVRELVDSAGGRCGAMSAVGVGSTFWFELPVKATLGTDEATTLPVLVVEDDPVNTLVVRRILEREGFRVESTDDPQDAVRRVLEARYALVLMDVYLTGADGIELTRRIREGEPRGGWRTEIVALTAAVTDDTPVRCLRAGMDGFQPKPIRRPALVALAAAALKRAEARIAAAEAEATVSGP